LTRVSLEAACAVCGRTILKGERVHSFVSAEGRHEVCTLCADRAAAAGWLPADQEGAEEKLRAEGERKPGILGRLFARPDESGDDDFFEDELSPPPAPDPVTRRESHDLDTERYDVEAEWREEPKQSPRRRLSGLFGGASDEAAPEIPQGKPADLPAPAPLPDPAGRGMRPRRLQPDMELSPATRFERAIVRFNASDAGRTVTGLTRTLGAPSVSVGDLAGSTDEVRVTVAWELTWYQWGVDLGDELRPVYELNKGFEVTEIEAPARQWNASAHDGRVVLVAPRRREAVEGKPVHR
jgi:hypothetical protein